MASTAPSGAAAAGTGGGGDGGGSCDVICSVARQIAPFLGHELNAALYRYDALSATLMVFTRHRSERPGALAVRMVPPRGMS